MDPEGGSPTPAPSTTRIGYVVRWTAARGGRTRRTRGPAVLVAIWYSTVTRAIAEVRLLEALDSENPLNPRGKRRLHGIDVTHLATEIVGARDLVYHSVHRRGDKS